MSDAVALTAVAASPQIAYAPNGAIVAYGGPLPELSGGDAARAIVRTVWDLVRRRSAAR